MFDREAPTMNLPSEISDGENFNWSRFAKYGEYKEGILSSVTRAREQQTSPDRLFSFNHRVGFNHPVFKALFVAILVVVAVFSRTDIQAEPLGIGCTPKILGEGIATFPSEACCSQGSRFSDCGECVEAGQQQRLFRDCRGQ